MPHTPEQAPKRSRICVVTEADGPAHKLSRAPSKQVGRILEDTEGGATGSTCGAGDPMQLMEPDHHRLQPSQSQVSRFNASSLAVRESGAGQIKSVHVKNFMCHTNMEVELREHVNFISGPNGSGKSAILQALQFCLGVRATATGRARSNAQYVKNGTDCATAEVTIWNTGEGGFHPSLYGPWITIKKTLTGKGASSTKVLDARGHQTDIKKADQVKHLLGHLCVNAANPAIVLTQDHARGLLSGDRLNSKLFELLSEALGFEQTEALLADASLTIEKQFEELGQFIQMREEILRQLEELEGQLDSAKKALKWGKLKEDLEDMMPWSVYWYCLSNMCKLKKELDEDGPMKLQELERRRLVAEQETASVAAAVVQQEALIQELSDKMKAFKDQQEEVRRQGKEAMRVKNDAHKALTASEHDFVQKQEQRSFTNEQLNRARAASTNAGFDAQMKEWNDARARARDAVTASQQASEAGNAAYKGAMRHVTDAEEAANNASYAATQQDQRVTSLEQELRSLQQNTGDRQVAATFDVSAPGVMAEIHRQGRGFLRPPIGPIGAHLALTDTSYSSTVTGALRRVLDNWLVDNAEDYARLQGIFRRVYKGRHPTIFRTRYAIPKHTIQEHQLPPPNLTTIAGILQIKPGTYQPDTIFNFLVDQAHIERLVLAQSEHDGQLVLTQNPSPRNVKTIWCRNEARGPVQIQPTGQSVSTFPWPSFEPLPQDLLSKDVSAILAAKERELVHATERCAALRAAQVASAEALVAARAAACEAQSDTHAQYRALSQAKDSFQQLDGQRPQVPADISADLGAWMDELQTLEQDLDRLGPHVDSLRARFKEAEEMHRRALEEKEGNRRRQDELRTEFETVQAQLDETSRRRAEIAKIDQTFEAKQAEVRRRGNEIAGAIQEFQSTADTARESAKQICSEEEAKEDVAELRAKLMEDIPEYFQRHKITVDALLQDHMAIKRLMATLQQRVTKAVEGASGHGVDWLEAEVEKMSVESAVHVQEIDRVRDLVNLEQESLKRRIDKYWEIKLATGHVISDEFKKKLKTGRNWRGRIVVDYESQSVQLEVAPSKGVTAGPEGAVKDMKSLSGGERSFTGVSFVLSLGKEIRTPFFAMDEFDVFMDAVNRKVSLTSILKFAWEMQDVQFILLTPLDMAVVEQARASVNDALQESARGAKAELMPARFVHTLAMHPPREGARAHY